MKKATIYTRTGDSGETSLAGGTRVSKDHARVEAYGTIDELNASLGLLATILTCEEKAFIQQIENTLFTIGCHISHEGACNGTIGKKEIQALEDAIDRAEAQLPPLYAFILPCEGEAAARANMCRAICRRAERRITTLQKEAPVAQSIMQYINRLSDYLFLLQRKLAQGAEKKWEKPCE